MRISRYELDTLIKEEVNEILGFGKKESSKQYPADEMAYLLSRLFAIASEVGVEPDDDTRATIVDEISGLLKGEGYELHEQLNLGGNVEFALTGGEAPKLLGLIKDIITKKPAAATLITRLFKRGAIDTDIETELDQLADLDIEMGSLATAPPASAAAAAKDTATPADKAATTSTKPSADQIGPSGSTVSPEADPEDLIATDKVTAVAVPGQEESPETLKKGDIVRVVDDPHLDPGDYEVFATNRGDTGTDVVLTDREGQDPKVLAYGMKLVADQPENYQVNPEIEEPEEEEAPIPGRRRRRVLLTGDIVRVKENDISGIKPGDYEVADIYTGPRSDPQPWVLLTAVDGEGGYRDHLSLIVDNPEFFKINPLLPKIKNPWAFKYFWEEDDEEEEDHPDWMKKAVKGIKGVLGGSNTSIKVVGGLTGIAGIVGLMKYLAKDEEKVDEAAALKKGAELEELGELSPKNDFGFITSTLRFVLSLSLDKEHMKTYDLVAEAIRLALVWKNDPRSEEFDEEVSKALDKIPGIEWLDKFYPGGREKVIGVVRERWDDMTLEEKISLIVALLPQNVVERLEALIPGPDMSEMDMRWPDVQDEIGEWLATGELELQPSHWSSFAGLLFAAADMFGLLDYHQTDTALGILYYTDLVLQDAKDNSQLDRMTKIMDALFEHKKQLNRMKVLAGVK